MDRWICQTSGYRAVYFFLNLREFINLQKMFQFGDRNPVLLHKLKTDYFWGVSNERTFLENSFAVGFFSEALSPPPIRA